MSEARWKLLHLVGDDISTGKARQLAAQIDLLPNELFAHQIAVAEPIAGRTVSRAVAPKVVKLDRRFKSDLLASRKLRKLIGSYSPELVVCWDLAATEQLRLALLGTRVKLAAAMMMFAAIRTKGEMHRLGTNYHGLSLHLIGSSDCLQRFVRAELGFSERIHQVTPCAGDGPKVDKGTARSRIGLSEADQVIFLSDSGTVDEVIRGIWGCAIVRRLHPQLKIIMTATDTNARTLYRSNNFAERMSGPGLLAVCDSRDERLAIAAADVYLEPKTDGSAGVGMVEAIADGVPVVATDHARFMLGSSAGELTFPIVNHKPRSIAAAVLAAIEDGKLRQKIVRRACDWCAKDGSKMQYRANLVRLYCQILERHWRP